MAIYREFARLYLEIAKKDLELAIDAFNRGNYPEAVFHAQQCVEKSVKAMLEARMKYVYNHGPALIPLFEETFSSMWRSDYDVIVEALDYLRDFYTSTRYPKLVGDRVLAPWDIIDKEIASKSIDYARKVLSIATNYLREENII